MKLFSSTKSKTRHRKNCWGNSVFFEFHSEFCLVKSQVSKELLLKGMVGCDGLYQFPDLFQSARQQLKPSFTVNSISAAGSEPVPTASSPHSVSPSVNRINPSVSRVNTLSNSDLSFAPWHSPLDHPSGDTMKLVSKLSNISIVNKTGSDFCSLLHWPLPLLLLCILILLTSFIQICGVLHLSCPTLVTAIM